MPSRKVNTKMTGDTHLPEIESDMQIEGSPVGLGTKGKQSGNAVKKAGVITDGEDRPVADDRFEDRRGTGGEPGA